MKLKDNSTQEIDTALYQLEQRLKSNIRFTDVENSNASTAKINAVDKKLTEEVKDRQSADEKLQNNINKEVADRKEADAAIENAKQDKLIAGKNIQIDGNVISATSTEYTAEAPIKVTDGTISLDTVPITKGGTGVTTQADINKAFIGNLDVGVSDVTDGTEFVSSYASDNGFNETAEGSLNTPYKRKFSAVWGYIKGKISSVLGLTKDNYGGKSAKSSFLDEYPGAGSARLTSLNIVPKDSSEYGGMRKDVVTSSVTDGSHPGQDGHLLTMFWDNTGRYDSQFFVSNSTPLELKARFKADTADYGAWTDIITSNNIGSQTVARAGTADRATSDANGNNIVNTYATKTELEKTTTKSVSLSTVTTGTTKYIKLGTFHWYDSFSFKCRIAGNSFQDNVNINILGGNSNYSSVCGYYSTNSRLTKSIIVKRGEAWNSDFEIYLKIVQLTTAEVYVTIDKDIQNRINISESTTAPSGTLEEIAFNNLNGMFTNIIDAKSFGSKLTIQGNTVSSNSYTDTNPKLEFKNNNGSQNISLTFTDFDAVQAPASLTLNGNQGNEYLIAPNIKATTKFIGNLTGNVTGNVSGSSGSCTGNSATATSASKLTTARTAYVALWNANTTTSIDWSGTTAIPVDGVLSVENGGTGCNTANAAANSLINNLTASDDVPVDTDYFISQHVNGGPFVPAYERRPVSKLWEYIKDKILQEGEDFGYNHIVHDDASLLEWANCTDGHMTKVLVKSGTYNMTKGVDFSKAGTGYVFAENGAVINSKVPIAFTAPSGKTTIHNLSVVCGPSSDNTCAFSASDILNLILYDCEASYATNTEAVNRRLFSHCTCYNCHYNFTNSSSNSSITLKVFYQCYCYNCICKQTIAANSSTGIVFGNDSYFYMECVCVSCDAELTTLRNIKAATTDFTCYYNCWDRCIGCLSKINVNSNALTVYSTLYGFLRCQHMSSCKEVHTVGYSNIKGVVQCIYVSSTSAVSGESNTNVGNSCDI